MLDKLPQDGEVAPILDLFPGGSLTQGDLIASDKVPTSSVPIPTDGSTTFCTDVGLAGHSRKCKSSGATCQNSTHGRAMTRLTRALGHLAGPSVPASSKALRPFV